MGGVAHDEDVVSPGIVLLHRAVNPQHVRAGGIDAGDAFPAAQLPLAAADPVRADDDHPLPDLGGLLDGDHPARAELVHHPAVVNERSQGIHGHAGVARQDVLHHGERPPDPHAHAHRVCPPHDHRNRMYCLRR